MKTNLYSMVLVLFTILFNGCSNISHRDIYILPKDYQGCVLIVFNMQNSSKENFDDQGNRVFMIPPSGILETRSMPNKSLKLMSKFYYNTSNGLEEIKYIDTGEWDNYTYGDTLKFVSTMEYGEHLKPWKAFVVGKVIDSNICNDRHKYILNYFSKLFSNTSDIEPR